MEKHLKLLGALHIVYGALIVIIGVVLFVVVAGGGQLAQDIDVERVTAGLGATLGVVVVILGLPSLVGGIGLLARKSWAWMLVLIGGCAALLSFPIGTVLGVYTIWALMKSESRSLLTH